MPLSKQPYKGARDFYPEDKRTQKYIFNKLRSVVESYGYEEYDAPILEPLELYLAKTSEEIVKEQTYAFKDRGGRDVVIRPEMTPSVSRLVAGRRQELAYPVRWYSLPNLWRYERPQKGRLREHWQLNVDMFGVSDSSAEVEMIMLISDVFKAFGAKTNMYEIRINHRGLTNYFLKKHLGFSDTTSNKISSLIDKLDKLERPDFISQLDNLLSDKQREEGAAEALLTILSTKKLSDLPTEFQEQPAYSELEGVLTALSDSGIRNAKFDVSLMRGFDYYTGIVFEVYDTHSDNRRSMLGGGRYDGLVGLFGVCPVPTVGFGWGDVTLARFLELHRLLPPLEPEAQVNIALAGVAKLEGMRIAASLRKSGLNVAVDITGRKLGDQIRAAHKKGYRYVLIIGEEELASNRFNLKTLATGSEKKLSLKEIEAEIKKNR